MSAPGAPRGSAVSRSKPLLLAWLVLLAWTSLPWLRAELFPPPGYRFVGTFHWIDDFYNYVSYVQQAEDGAWLLENKLWLEPRPDRIFHLEWGIVGRLSALLGSRPFLAYRLLAAILALALLAAADRWLLAAGLDPTHRLPALLLVATGGGLGGPIFTWTDWPAEKCLDLSLGLYPFLEVLANPHFLAGTTLLACGLLAFGSGHHFWGVALGTAAGLSRPYDLATLGLLGGLLALLRPGSLGDRLRRLLPLLGLVPVLGYQLWVFFSSDAFASFRGEYPFPAPALLVPALGPAAALALLGLTDRPVSPTAAAARLGAWLWALFVVLLALLQPASFGLQFLVGGGLPWLGLAALALSRRGGAMLLWTAWLLLSPSAVVATRIVSRFEPHWFAPAPRLEAALALRAHCHPGQRVLAPPDIGLYVTGLTACRALVSHPAGPGHAAGLADLQAFQDGAPLDRQRLLDRLRIDFVALPDVGPRPAGILGPGTPFRRVPGGGPQVAWYSRSAPIP